MRSARQRLLIPGLLALPTLLLVGIGSVAAEDQNTAIVAFKFEPANITVQVGDTITWENKDRDDAHTATADDGSFDTGAILFGQTGTVAFDAAGTFPFYCKPHPFMRGTVVVQAAAAESSAAGTTQPETSTEGVGQDAAGAAGLSLLLLLLGAVAFLLTLSRIGRQRSG